ncbi:hypothetical protein F9B82_00695 [Lacticaseibacillus casei]|nr:hypothetical protein F9B82_00695 [Lacticaseibacillus casei]
MKLVLNGWFSRFRPRPSFETAVFAGSKSCPQRSSPSWPEIAEFGTVYQRTFLYKEVRGEGAPHAPQS